MDTFSMTDMGLLRNSNQDSVFCEENPIGRFPNLFLVADGMGGHKAGDLASRFCIAEKVKLIQSSTALHYHLAQITVDHSPVEEMVLSGEIQMEDMRTHPNKNIITRALGTDDTVRPDCFEVKVEPGDVLLLCSDGLTNMVEDSQIEKIVKENKEYMKLAGEKLVQQANEAGGKDNISVILVRL